MTALKLPPAGLRAPPLCADLQADLEGSPAWIGLGAAYEHPDGSMLVLWPQGGGPLPRATYGSLRDLTTPAPVEHRLLALGLSHADCLEVARVWDLEFGRAPRREAIERLAPARARERAGLLRALRRGEPPLGSYCLAQHRRGPPRLSPLVRYPNGSGWWGSRFASSSYYAWPWEERDVGPVARLLAVGLSEADCRALSTIEDCELAAQEVLARGLG